MKTNVKIMLISLIVLFASTINAQNSPKEKIDNFKKNCKAALTHNNSGVVESAIYVSIQFKNLFPEENDKEFVNVLNELANNSDNARISYKAQLAKLYFNNRDWFKEIEIKSINSEDEVYEEIAEKVNSIIFASRL